ncbi:MAG: hypothetical protein ACPL7J_05675, partial [Desulfomonilaceae bacterium]
GIFISRCDPLVMGVRAKREVLARNLLRDPRAMGSLLFCVWKRLLGLTLRTSRIKFIQFKATKGR